MCVALLPMASGWQDVHVFIKCTATMVFSGSGAWVLHAVIYQTYAQSHTK
jgi:hypothetical protein